MIGPLAAVAAQAVLGGSGAMGGAAAGGKAAGAGDTAGGAGGKGDMMGGIGDMMKKDEEASTQMNGDFDKKFQLGSNL